MNNNRFFGNWIIFYTFILMFFIFTIINSLHSLFLVPVTKSLGMDRSAFSLIFTITGISVAFTVPVITKLLKYVSIRKILIGSILMTSLGFASYAFATKAWHFYIIAIIVGVGATGCTNLTISLLINNWFIARRGMALGIAFTGSGFGAVVIAPLLTKILNMYGWQLSYIICGLTMAVICIPLTFLFAYQYPSDKGQNPYQEKENDDVFDASDYDGVWFKDIKYKPAFWIFLIISIMTSITLGGIHVHIPAYLTDLGHTPSFIATIIMIQAIFLIIGKLVLGMIFDKYGNRIGTVCLGFFLTMAFICFILAKNSIFAIIFAVFYGLGATITTVGFSYLTSSIFGQKDYSTIYGVVNIAIAIGSSTGPFLSGILYDCTHQYQYTWIAYLIIFTISITCLCLLEKFLEKNFSFNNK